MTDTFFMFSLDDYHVSKKQIKLQKRKIPMLSVKTLIGTKCKILFWLKFCKWITNIIRVIYRYIGDVVHVLEEVISYLETKLTFCGMLMQSESFLSEDLFVISVFVLI